MKFHLVLLTAPCLWAQSDSASKLAEKLERRCELRIQAGEVEEGLSDCNVAITLDPANPSHHVFCGIQLWKLARFAEAYSQFSAALARSPKSCKVLAYRGASEINLGHPIPALRDLDAAIDCDPKDPLAWHSRALAHMMLSNLHRALQDFSKAIDLDPQRADAYENRARCFEGLGNKQRAAADHAKALEIRTQKR